MLFYYFITDPPVVSPLPNVKHVVGDHVKITCVVTAGNPSSTTVYWTKSGNSGFGQSGSSLVFPNISRTQNGIYSCVAENNYLIGGKGTDQQSFLLDVLCRHLHNLNDFEVFTINTLYYITFYVHNNQRVAKMILQFCNITFFRWSNPCHWPNCKGFRGTISPVVDVSIQ